MSNISALAVYLHGRMIGTITRLGGDRTIFAFDEHYARDDQRATLSISMRSESGALITSHRAYQTHLMPFFSNLLPEGALRAYLAKRTGVSEHSEFDLLEQLGADLPGALRIVPADRPAPDEVKAGNAPAKERDSETQLRFSLAGVQLKFSAFENKTKQGGLTIPANGAGGSWIIKLPSLRHDGVPENEFAMMTLARKIGINIPDIALIDINDIGGLPEDIGKLGPRAFAIKRFDRSEQGAVHIEDFAQVFGVYPDDKYKKASYRNILSVLASATDLASATEFMRRLVFSVLIGNGDMHLKNWSLIYPDQQLPILAPAYDLLSTIPYIPGDDSALKFARVKRFAEFGRDEIAYMAAKTRLPATPLLAVAEETISRFMELWPREKNHFELHKNVVESIDAHLLKLTLLKERT